MISQKFAVEMKGMVLEQGNELLVLAHELGIEIFRKQCCTVQVENNGALYMMTSKWDFLLIRVYLWKNTSVNTPAIHTRNHSSWMPIMAGLSGLNQQYCRDMMRMSDSIHECQWQPELGPTIKYVSKYFIKSPDDGQL